MVKTGAVLVQVILLLAFLNGCSGTAAVSPSPITTGSISSTPSRTTLFILDRLDSLPPGKVKIHEDNDLYPPVLHSDDYEKPVPLPFPVNTAGAEDSPFILPDGNTLYFFFTPDPNIPVEKQLFDGVTGIYRCSKKADGAWSEPERIILNDDIALDGAEYINGSAMWFASTRPGYTGVRLFTAELIGGVWRNWQYAGGRFPAGYEVGEFHFSTDWKELYFHSLRPGGKGGYDIWMTRDVDGVWQEPVNIEVVNSMETDGWPYLTQDGNELWFLRFYLGTPAIFRSVKLNGEWGEPELIISQFAGEPSLDNDGNIYFVHHYYKDGVMLEADIYVAKKK
jgi:hypothetical protein